MNHPPQVKSQGKEEILQHCDSFIPGDVTEFFFDRYLHFLFLLRQHFLYHFFVGVCVFFLHVHEKLSFETGQNSSNNWKHILDRSHWGGWVDIRKIYLAKSGTLIWVTVVWELAKLCQICTSSTLSSYVLNPSLLFHLLSKTELSVQATLILNHRFASLNSTIINIS